MQHQFDWYNLFIQTVPERILVKLRAHLMATQIKYTTWQHMANLDHFAKLVVAIDNRLELLKHEEPITYIYEPHERIRYEWIHD